MKKFLGALAILLSLQGSVSAQDFVLINPTIGPNPGVFPGMETSSFDFYSTTAYTFSSDPLSNNYATITFSFTKMNPALVPPTGTGAALFNWTLTTNGGVGVGLTYTWTGTSKTVSMTAWPASPRYKITFTNVPITFEATAAQTDIRVAGQFTDPGNAQPGSAGNNAAVIATYTSAAGPTPINLLSFDALKQTSSVDLKWQTSSEQNSNYFDVEFSSDGNVWQSIGRVQAAGNSSSQLNYSLTHTTPVKGVNYYRLKQVDKNGNVVYSEIRIVNFGSKGAITILPNPVIDRVYITSNNNALFTSIKLFSTDGKQLQEYTNFTSGNSISMSNYPSGAYVLKVTDKNGNVEVDKVIKQ